MSYLLKPRAKLFLDVTPPLSPVEIRFGLFNKLDAIKDLKVPEEA